jgi:hypothetical protein
MNRITTTDRNAPLYTYSLGSLNGCICYRQTILSMMYWLGHQDEGFTALQNMETIVDKAESWTSMRVQYLSSVTITVPDRRLFDSEQIQELKKADNYDEMFNLLLSFRESSRLSFENQ